MKRLTLLLLLGGLFSYLQAQQSNHVSVSMNQPGYYMDGYTSQAPVPFTSTFAYHASQQQQQPTQGGNRAVTFIPIGTAGNLYTILDGTINRVSANNTLNTVTFIHRANPDSIAGSNIGQYTYDVSTDGGDTWSTDNGILNDWGNNISLAGRYPNAAIFNPSGNTSPSNAYLSYLGSWLPFSAAAADWEGYFSGVARLDNDPATITQDSTIANNGNVSIARGLCNGAPGIQWAVDWAFDGTEFTGILLYRGVWNTTTNQFDWGTYETFTPPFDRSFEGTSQATALNMAFDQTGQYGWIAFTGDITAGGNNVMNPAFYRTTNGGATWTGPIVIDLTTLDNVVNNLLDPGVDIPSTSFDLDIVVDKNGNPHVAFGVHAGSDYSVTTGTGASMNLYDLTRIPSAAQGCEWQAIHISSLQTFRGTISGDVIEDTRPQASITPDGRFVTIGWSDSDPNQTGGENTQPDLWTRAIDIDNGLATAVENQSAGTNYAGAALFASFAPTSLMQGNTIYAPAVIARLNPLTFTAEDPALFYYVNGLDYDITTDFVDDVYAPVITLNGANPMTVQQGGTYTEPGATAEDNVDGTITSGFTINGTVNTAVPGAYAVTYTVSDATGNEACVVTRIVNVVTVPDVIDPVITVLGDNPDTIDICDFYTDPGATAVDNVDGNLTSNITVSGIPAGSPSNPRTPGTYTITYSVTDGAGNTGTATRTLVVQDLVPPTITLAGGDTVNVEKCGVYQEFGYFIDDNCSGITATITGNVNTQVSGTYTIDYEVNDGSTIVTTTRYVIVGADVTPPTITVPGANPTYVYLNEPYTDVIATATDACSGVETVTSNAASINTTSRDTLEVTYTATDSVGNVSTATRTVIVGTEPDARFNYNVVSSNSAQINFTDQSLYNPTSWSWDFGDGINYSQAKNKLVTYASSGTYTVCLTVENVFNEPPFNKPADDTCMTIDVTVGIEDMSALEAAFTVYPNPTTGVLNLNISSMNFEKMDVTVLNTMGAKVLSNSYNQVNAQSNYQLNLGDFAKGVYLIRIQTEQGVVTKRVVLQPAN